MNHAQAEEHYRGKIFYQELYRVLSTLPPRTVIRMDGMIPHPEMFGAYRSRGLDVGQVEDWRFPPNPDGSGLHVQRFRDGWAAHLDAIHPETSPLEHAREDAPFVVGAASAVIGAISAVALTKRPFSAVMGAFLGGLFGRALVPQDLPTHYDNQHTPPNQRSPTKRAKRRY